LNFRTVSSFKKGVMYSSLSTIAVAIAVVKSQIERKRKILIQIKTA
jgi:hypothetical protein